MFFKVFNNFWTLQYNLNEKGFDLYIVLIYNKIKTDQPTNKRTFGAEEKEGSVCQMIAVQLILMT